LPPPKKFTEVFWVNGEHLIVLGEHLVKSVMLRPRVLSADGGATKWRASG
jgi:hypothetical protein